MLNTNISLDSLCRSNNLAKSYRNLQGQLDKPAVSMSPRIIQSVFVRPDYAHFLTLKQIFVTGDQEHHVKIVQLTEMSTKSADSRQRFYKNKDKDQSVRRI